MDPLKTAFSNTETRPSGAHARKKSALQSHNDAVLGELFHGARNLLVQTVSTSEFNFPGNSFSRFLTGVMPAGMFSIDSILSGRPSCKEPLLLHRSGPVVLSTGLTESIYTDYNGLYPSTCGPSPPGIQSVNGTRIGYNGYYYGQLHVQGAGGGPPCCSSVPGLSPQQCPCIPTGRLCFTLFYVQYILLCFDYIYNRMIICWRHLSVDLFATSETQISKTIYK